MQSSVGGFEALQLPPKRISPPAVTVQNGPIFTLVKSFIMILIICCIMTNCDNLNKTKMWVVSMYV